MADQVCLPALKIGKTDLCSNINVFAGTRPLNLLLFTFKVFWVDESRIYVTYYL